MGREQQPCALRLAVVGHDAHHDLDVLLLLGELGTHQRDVELRRLRLGEREHARHLAGFLADLRLRGDVVRIAGAEGLHAHAEPHLHARRRSGLVEKRLCGYPRLPLRERVAVHCALLFGVQVLEVDLHRTDAVRLTERLHGLSRGSVLVLVLLFLSQGVTDDFEHHEQLGRFDVELLGVQVFEDDLIRDIVSAGENGIIFAHLHRPFLAANFEKGDTHFSRRRQPEVELAAHMVQWRALRRKLLEIERGHVLHIRGDFASEVLRLIE